MSIGPVEYLILGFPGNKFTGQIVPELAKLIDSGLIRIIDLAFISKDSAGHVEVVEYDAVEELAAFAGLDAEVGGILTDEDIAHAAVSLEPNTSAALLIWEDSWAAPARWLRPMRLSLATSARRRGTLAAMPISTRLCPWSSVAARFAPSM